MPGVLTGMHRRLPWAWVVLHLVPLPVLPVLIGVAAAGLTAEATAVTSYALLFAFVAGGQQAVTRIQGWGLRTAIGLLAAWAAGMTLLALLDPILRVPETATVGLAYSVCGAALGAFQARCLRKDVRIAWTAASAAACGLGALLASAIYPAAWLPGFVAGAFPGRLEITTIVRLLPLYAVMTLPVLARAPVAAPSPAR